MNIITNNIFILEVMNGLINMIVTNRKNHNITKLNFTYLSSEIKDGWFECVYEILQNIVLECLLKNTMLNSLV